MEDVAEVEEAAAQVSPIAETAQEGSTEWAMESAVLNARLGEMVIACEREEEDQQSTGASGQGSGRPFLPRVLQNPSMTVKHLASVSLACVSRTHGENDEQLLATDPWMRC